MKLSVYGNKVTIVNGEKVQVYTTEDTFMLYRLNSDAYEVCLDLYVGFIAIADIQKEDGTAYTIDELKEIFKRNLEIAYSVVPIEAGTAVIKPVATVIPKMGPATLSAMDEQTLAFRQSYSDEITGLIAGIWLHIMQGDVELIAVNAGTPSQNVLNYTISGLEANTEYKVIPVVELTDGRFFTDTNAPTATTKDSTVPEVAISTLVAPGESYKGATAPVIEANVITYSGEIPYSKENQSIGRTAGNYAAIFIKTPEANLTNFPNMKIAYDGVDKWDKSVFNEDPNFPNTLLLWAKVTTAGEEHTITFKWDETQIETFTLKIAEGTTFNPGPDSPYDDGELEGN